MDNASCDDVVMMEESPVSNCPVCCQPLPLSQHELVFIKHIIFKMLIFYINIFC